MMMSSSSSSSTAQFSVQLIDAMKLVDGTCRWEYLVGISSSNTKNNNNDPLEEQKVQATATTTVSEELLQAAAADINKNTTNEHRMGLTTTFYQYRLANVIDRACVRAKTTPKFGSSVLGPIGKLILKALFPGHGPRFTRIRVMTDMSLKILMKMRSTIP